MQVRGERGERGRYGVLYRVFSPPVCVGGRCNIRGREEERKRGREEERGML
jgi:hypothetical protein